MSKKLTRLIVAAAGVLVALGVISLAIYLVEQLIAQKLSSALPGGVYALIVVLPCIAGGVAGYCRALPIAERVLGWLKKMELKLQGLPAEQVLLGSLGLLLGLLVAFLLSTSYAGVLPGSAQVAVNGLLYLIFGYLGIVILAKRTDETILNLFVKWMSRRFSGQAQPERGEFEEKILDTSAVIDGRIFGVWATGFLEGTLLAPDFVIQELQRLSDSADGRKRALGRRGLEMLQKARGRDGEKVEIREAPPSDEDVDIRLVRLAQQRGATLVSCDYNLNKAASLVGVKVLNVNELASAIREEMLPGERLNILIVKEGKDPRQGVGYLPDGAMVVVEDGREMVGRRVEAVVTKSLQTAAGRMIFARMA